MEFLSPHFTLDELTNSSRAVAAGIDNTPDTDAIKNLKDLCSYILEPLRIEWGTGITITSGYRCEALNHLVGGAKQSAHRRGHAADIIPANREMEKFKEFVKHWCKRHAFDQCIDETNRYGSEWMHVSLLNSTAQQRRQFLKTTDGKHYQKEDVL